MRRMALALLTASGAALGQGSRPAAPHGAMPVREVPAAAPSHRIAILLTGDGGWASFVRDLSAQLAAGGVSVVGVDSRAYLGDTKSPERIGVDLAALVRHYAAEWKASSVTVVGYSRGADIAPFGINRLPDSLRALVDQVVLIGLSANANFTFRWQDLIRDVRRPDDVPTRPEVEKLAPTPVLCFYGGDDASDVCRSYQSTERFRIIEHVGGHRPSDAATFARTILASQTHP